MTHSVCASTVYQNVLLLFDAMGSDLTCKDLIKKIICNPGSNKCIMHRSEPCPSTATLKKFLDLELNELEYDEQLNYCQ